MLAQIDPDKFIDYFQVQVFLWTVGQHCTGNFLVKCWPSQIKTTFYGLFSWEKMTECFGSTLKRKFLAQCCLTMYLDNFGQTIFLGNTGSLSENIVQGFYSCSGCPKSIKTTLNAGCYGSYSYAMMPRASSTTLRKVFAVQCCPKRYSWNNIAQIKTLCSVAW